MTVRIPSDDELRWLTTRAVAEIIPKDDFIRALQSGKQLRLKMGSTPVPGLTLGHAVGLASCANSRTSATPSSSSSVTGRPASATLRPLQDPPMLTVEQVNENAETYLKQFFKIVDRERTEIRPQSEWFDAFKLTEVVQLAGKFTVAQMMERDDFAQRYKQDTPSACTSSCTRCSGL
jgi:tyrosyl-tRNA synthetase